MSAYRAALIGRAPVAEGTLAFRFSRPAGFSFVAGQAIELELADPPLGDGEVSRMFSLVSAPHEDELVIATRMRPSAFKRALGALPEGASVGIDGPFGDLTLDAGAAPVVLIAGGIGITPFVSMLRQAAHEGSPRPIMLAYSNRRPEDAAFLDELQQLERRHPQFRMMATMTDAAKSARKWEGERGRLDAAKLRRLAGDLARPSYYLVGPPAMVEAMQSVLQQAGVAGDRIRSEMFFGY